MVISEDELRDCEEWGYAYSGSKATEMLERLVAEYREQDRRLAKLMPWLREDAMLDLGDDEYTMCSLCSAEGRGVYGHRAECAVTKLRAILSTVFSVAPSMVKP